MRFTISHKSVKKVAGVAAALMILPVAVACSETGPVETTEATTEETTAADTSTEATAAEGETIVDVAAANGSFNTLVAAVQAADLVETLSGEGPYTVFAPTDEAFAALPEGILEKLLLPENKAVLAQILTYHVVAGEVPSSDVTTGMVPTAAGEDLDVTAEAGSVTVNGANVVQADVMASNGVIHVIDTVLLPPSVDPAAL